MLYKESFAKDNFTIQDAIKIMEILRGQGGCPWDREQTHESIRENFIEEVYEAIEAIDTKDDALLKEELGDVLLQVLFHSKIAEDEGRFNINDVADGLCKKLIVRHPHIFSDVIAENSDKVLENWDNIKKKQKGFTTQAEVLKSISHHLPALMRAEKVQSKAAKVGFDWPDYKGAVDKIYEETQEVCEVADSADKDRLQEEIGDLLFSVVNLARLLDVEPETALAKSSDKFIGRFDKMEQMVISENKNFKEMSLEEMDKYWDKAKQN